MTTDREVLKALLNLLQEAGMVAGNFRVKTLFDFGFKVLRKTLVTLHGNLKDMVGEMPFEETPRSGTPSAVPGLDSPPGSLSGASSRSQYGSAASSMWSISGGTVERMQLGPGGAALIEAQICNATTEAQTQLLSEGMGTRCKVELGTPGPTTDQGAKARSTSPSTLQSHFEKAMVKFIEEQGAPKIFQVRGRLTGDGTGRAEG